MLFFKGDEQQEPTTYNLPAINNFQEATQRNVYDQLATGNSQILIS